MPVNKSLCFWLFDFCILMRVFSLLFPLLFILTQMQATFAVPAAGGSATTVFGTLLTIIVIIVVVMGGLFAFKRFYVKQNPNISMHFQNSRSAMEAARVKMSKFNDIRISRPGNNNSKHSSNSIPHATMIDEQEIGEPNSHDDTRNLLS